MQRLARPILLVLGFLMPVLVVAGWRGFGAMQRMVRYPIAPPPQIALPVARPPTGRPVVAILTSNLGTEVTDILYPHAVFHAAGVFDVVTVAPRRQVSPVTGGVDLLPDHSFASFADAYPQGADLIVVPFFLDATAPSLVEWLQANASKETEVLSICEGARTVAAAGLLAGKQATTHFWSVGNLAKHHPDTRWLLGARFVEDEAIISSAGVTASLDASLAAVGRLSGSKAVARVKEVLGVGSLPVLWRAPEIDYSQVGVLLLNGAFLTSPVPVVVALSDGVDDMHLAALLDTFPRSLVFDLTTVSASQDFLRSRFGLTLLARANTLPEVRTLFVPGGVRGVEGLEDQARRQGSEIVSLDAISPAGALPWALRGLADREDQATATLVGELIEAPEIPVVPGARSWPWPRLLVLIAVGTAGLLVVAWFTRSR